MRDQGSYNMSEARTSPDYKKCIYWMLIALLTCLFIAICVIAAIGYQKPDEDNRLRNLGFYDHPPSEPRKDTTTATPTTTTRFVDHESNDKEIKPKNDINLGNEVIESQETTKRFDFEPHFQNSKEVVEPKNDLQSNEEEEVVKNQETTQTNDFQNSKQVVEPKKDYDEEYYQLHRWFEYETNKIIKNQETTKINDLQSSTVKSVEVQEENDLESTTETFLDQRLGKTTPETLETSTKENLLKTSMSSREEELTSPQTTDATKIFEKATNFVSGFFKTTTTETPITEQIANTTTTTTTTTTIPSPVLETECKMKKVCDKNSCKKSASKMLALMDHSVEPCNDFYKFSCGGMKINHMELEVDENYLGIDFENLPDDDFSYLSKFKIYYESCLNFDALYPNNSMTLQIYLNRFIEKLEMFNSDLNDLTDLIGNIILSQPYGSSSRLMPLFDVVMDIGPDGKYIPVLTVPLSVSDIFEADTGDIYEQLCVKKSEVFAKTQKSAKNVHENYMNCLKDPSMYIENLNEALIKLNMFDNLPTQQKAQKASQVVWSIETDVIGELGLIPAQEKLKELRSAYNSPQYYQMKELNVKYAKIDWNRLFKKIFPDQDVSKLSVKVMFPDYLDKIFKFIEATKFEDLKSLLLAMTAHDMYVHYIKPHPVCSREKYCKKLTIKVLGDIATNMYLKKMNKKDYLHKEKVARELFDKLSTEYTSAVNNVSWLDIVEKMEFSSKIKSIKLITNFDLLEKEEERLQDKYNSTELMGCFITNNDLLKHLKRKTMYAKLDLTGDDPTNLWNFQIKPMEKQPITITPLKTIVLPFSVLDNSVPRFRESLQNYETYSKLGFMLSREISSFFNPTNIKSTVAKDNALYNVFVDLKLSYPKITENNLKINLDNEGILSTLDSRFSDDSALRLSYETYLKLESNDEEFLWMNYSISKLFYLSVAQQFCSSELKSGLTGIDFYENENLLNYFRVNSIVMNSVHFSKTFDCGLGSSMNPEVKVDQFPFIEQSQPEYVQDGGNY